MIRSPELPSLELEKPGGTVEVVLYSVLCWQQKSNHCHYVDVWTVGNACLPALLDAIQSDLWYPVEGFHLMQSMLKATLIPQKLHSREVLGRNPYEMYVNERL